MNRSIRRVVLALGAAALLWVSARAGAQTSAATTLPPPSPPGMPRLGGEAAWAKLIGNTIIGTTPDGPYTQFYAADGTVRHLDRDGPNSGRWRLDQAEICLDFVEDDTDCRKIEVDPDGRHGAFIDSDGSTYPFDILPGNARQL